MKDFHRILKKAKKKFPTHKWVRIKVNENAYNPFNSMLFEKIINDSLILDHKQYALYIHDTYLSIRSIQFKNYDPIKMELDSKLWVELYCIFEIDDTDDDNAIFESFEEIDDKPI